MGRARCPVTHRLLLFPFLSVRLDPFAGLMGPVPCVPMATYQGVTYSKTKQSKLRHSKPRLSQGGISINSKRFKLHISDPAPSLGRTRFNAK